MNNDLRVFLARSKLRKIVLKYLSEKPETASFLSEKMGKYREVISRIFLDLQKQGLVKCLNPSAPNFRFYNITLKGRDILKNDPSRI